MPRFTIKDLLLSTACVSVGCALLAVLYQNTSGSPNIIDELALPMWFTSGVLIGAGAFVPFKRPVIGVIVGVAVQHVLFAIAVGRRGESIMGYVPLFIIAALVVGGVILTWVLWKVARILNGFDRRFNDRD